MHQQPHFPTYISKKLMCQKKLPIWLYAHIQLRNLNFFKGSFGWNLKRIIWISNFSLNDLNEVRKGKFFLLTIHEWI